MRKLFTLLAGVAATCCSSQASFGQLQLGQFQPARPTVARVIASSQPQVGEVDPSVALDNPFDYVEPGKTPSSTLSSPANDNLDKAFSHAQPTASQPARGDVEGGKRSVIDIAIDYGTIAQVPHAAMVPICWDQAQTAPNYIAEKMLQEDCNERQLWNGYAAQRAAECETMWNHINGVHKYNQCGMGGVNCNNCTAPACNACALPVRNRYLSRNPAACPSCDASSHGTELLEINAPALPTQTGDVAGSVHPSRPAQTASTHSARQEIAVLPNSAIRSVSRR